MKLINANGYGFSLVPIRTFEKFRREQKIRTRKMLSYFAKNNATGDAFLQNGCMLPIAHIKYGEYAVFIEAGERNTPPGWTAIKEWKAFNICVDDDDSLWVLSLDDLEAWNIATYEGRDFCRQENVFDINDQPLERYSAIRYEVPKGNYEATIVGLKSSDGQSKYGVSVFLSPTSAFAPNADASQAAFHDMFL